MFDLWYIFWYVGFCFNVFGVFSSLIEVGHSSFSLLSTVLLVPVACLLHMGGLSFE